MFEKIFFKKIELWLALLCLVAFIFVMIIFGALVRDHYLNASRFENLSKIAAKISSVPSQIYRLVFQGTGNAEVKTGEKIDPKKSGLNIYHNDKSLGFLLLNRYDGNISRGVTELIDLNNGKTIHTWNFKEINKLWKKSKKKIDNKIFQNAKTNLMANRYFPVHGLLTNEGDIMVANGPMHKANVCSELSIFQAEYFYHHSLELDYENNYWSPVYLSPNLTKLVPEHFIDDGIVKVSSDGDILFKKSVIDILNENNLGYLINERGILSNDAIHLNDIQPVLDDGKYWKKGDIFLSVRDLSLVLLYRPSTNKIIWHKLGPWIHQHDIDILNDKEIIIFNNNARATSDLSYTINENEVSNSILYNFESSSITYPYIEAYKNHNIRAESNGLQEVLENKNLIMIENHIKGRLIIADKMGKKILEYNNTNTDGYMYRTSWSRYIPRNEGQNLVKIIEEKKSKCF